METDIVTWPVLDIDSKPPMVHSSVKSGQPGSTIIHGNQVCLCSLRRFVDSAQQLLQNPDGWCSFHSVPDSVHLVTSAFKQAAQTCLKMVDGFCEAHHSEIIELFVMRIINFSIANPVLINMEEFPQCLMWFFSWSKKWESALDFIRSYFQTVFRGDSECVLAKLHGQLGSVFIATAEKEKTAEKNAETLSIAADHMWESGRIYSARQNFELASKAYYEAVRAARVSKNLQKAGLVLMEALEATLLWNGNEKSKLWECLHVLVGCYQAENKLSEAVDLLKRGLVFTCNWKLTNEDRRKYVSLAVGIESTVGDALLFYGSHDRVPELTSTGDGSHDHSGDAPNATSSDQPLEERTSLTKHGRSLGRDVGNEEKCQVAKALFNFCSQLCPGSTSLKLKFNAAYGQYISGAREEGLKAFGEALEVVTNDSERYEMCFQVELLIKYSDLLDNNGCRVKSRAVLKEAHRLFCNADFVNGTHFCYGATYILGRFLGAWDISSAVDFAQHLDSGTSSYEHGSMCPNMQLLKSRLCEAIDDKEGVADHLGARYELLERQSNEMQDELGDINDLFNRRAWDRNRVHGHSLKREYTKRTEFENLMLDVLALEAGSEEALSKLIEARTISQNELGNDPSVVGPVALRLAFSYSLNQKYRLAAEEWEIASKCFEALEEHNPVRIHHLGLLFICKAIDVGFIQGNYDEARDWIDKARPYMQDINSLDTCDDLIVGLKRHRYGLDADICKEIIKVSVTNDGRFPSIVDSQWIKELERSIGFYRHMEWHALNDEGNNKQQESRGMQALLWAERSRARLFMHISGEQIKAALNTSKLTDFDENDAYGEGTIKRVLEECGNNVAFIEFSYWGDDNRNGNLFMYVIFMAGDELKVYPFQINFLLELKAKWNKDLEDYVNSVIGAIKSKEEGDKQAKEYLSYLHDVLRIGFIMTLLPEHCDTIAFAPQGYLSFLPLHALYDKVRDEFLIQRYRICYIPSIRVLSHCLQLQKMRRESRSFNKPAFVAGNPHPMGCNLRSLPEAEEEAKEVAEILGVQPCVREKMSKVAVKDGLCQGSIVLLATHVQYPPGAIVVRGVDHHNNNVHNFEDETITTGELRKLHINADLVVLDGCETGKGEITSEGVLGLGRSILQSGASTVVLSLWEVDDQASRILVTDMFRNAIGWPSSVSDSLGTSMLNMLHNTNIYHWAPLIVVGSPTLCINDFISKGQKEHVNAGSSCSTNNQTFKQNSTKTDKRKEAQISSPSFKSNVEVHANVECDECKTIPIIGPRFKSRASYKRNYDLCLTCFTGSGCTLSQFDRIELPLTFLKHGTPLDPCSVLCMRESCIRGGKCQCIKVVVKTQPQMGCIARGLMKDLS